MTEVEEKTFNEDFRVVLSASRVVKIKKRLPFCRKFSMLCIEDRVVVDRVV